MNTLLGGGRLAQMPNFSAGSVNVLEGCASDEGRLSIVRFCD